jgi:pseudouridine-5'-monophosphatase
VFTREAKLAAMGRVAIESAKSIVKNCQLPITPEQYLEELRDLYPVVFAHVSYMPGAKKLISHFHKEGIPQAIATSSTKNGYELKSRDQAQLFNSLFEHVLTASSDPEVKEGKPAPDTFLIAAQRFKTKPKDMKSVRSSQESISIAVFLNLI